MIVRAFEPGDGTRYTIGLSYLAPGPARAAGFAPEAQIVVAVELNQGAVMMYGSTHAGAPAGVYRCLDPRRSRATRQALESAASRFLTEQEPRT